jgi:spartin
VASHAAASLTRLAASPLLYPTVDPDELVENLFPEAKEDEDAAPPLPATEETLIAMPGVQLHLIDPDRSVDLGAGTLSIVRLLQGGGHSVASGHASCTSILIDPVLLQGWPPLLLGCLLTAS